ncbi:MAG: hypothetical protein SynsKO_44690 [Synoicihabitans sp.]
MAPRRDPYHKLVYVLSGEVAFREIDRKREIVAKAGSVLVVPRKTTHQFADQEPSTLLLMCFEDALLGAPDDAKILWRTLRDLPEKHVRMSGSARQRLEGMWRRAMFEWEHQRIGGATAVRAIAAQTLVLLSRLPVESGDASALARVRAVHDEIAETFYDEWDLDRAAERAGLSRRRFTTLFREVASQTFGNFLNELRLNHAAKLLRAGDHSVTGVMFAAGFNDVSHFYRRFRQKYGQPPRAWSADVDNA